ncbi:hypothetical protein KSF_096110 [Reticulibacter mediterranei]|uniref:Uncharacterized protein n=1 Tax=Reticulibacter mediterranei TaxID=2778369 RepID=A0A8J3N8D0_9CHLR|nr:hypothetical protein [Reticulibacter mediterranei]GHO99563.1 hypothetical protein KSF_096110 [Reticulibacter mediterranei]
MSRRKYVIMILAALYALTAVLAIAGVAQAQSTQVAASGPVSQSWFLPEGRVGAGFVQWITVGNPNSSDCTVNIQYDYTMDGASTGLVKTVSFSVPHLSRHTQYVNGDLNIKQFATGAATLSTIVSTSDCPGIVVERPMYFSGFHGTSSGTDVLGATQPGKTWYFAEIPSGSAGETFLSVLNPTTSDAHVTVTYYVGGIAPISVSQTVHANSRGTFQPNGIAQLVTHQHAAVKVTADQPIVVERASYFPGINGVSGSAAVMGIAAPANSWVFAAGTVRSGALENITIAADPGASAAIPFTITLISASGATASFDETVDVHGQLVFNVNTNNTFSGHTDDVSAIVAAKNPDDKLLVQRQIFESYSGSNPKTPGWSAQGVSDSPGVPMSTTAGPQVYSFAEGFASANFNEWLMLVNPTSADENITVQLTNMLGEQSTNTVPVGAHSRVSFDVTSMVNNSSNVFSLSKSAAYAVSATVSADGPFAAERVMYWNAFSTKGTSALPGFTQAQVAA